MWSSQNVIAVDDLLDAARHLIWTRLLSPGRLWLARDVDQ